MQKAKKEDFRVEEELRSQKAKYEEMSEDVFRRMQDIKEAEVDSVADLTAFLDAELSYYDRCREVLLQLKRDWPAGEGESLRKHRTASSTAHSYADRFNPVDEVPELPPPEPRPTISSTRAVSSNYAPESPRRDMFSNEYGSARPRVNRSNTFEGPTQLHDPLVPLGRLSKVPTDTVAVRTQRSQLRSVSRITPGNEVFDDPSDDSSFFRNSSPERSYGERPASPATSYGSVPSRSASSSTLNAVLQNGKKQPPPPPPSRNTKPPASSAQKPPPPPPMKRSALSTSSVQYA
ncbi:hypothetical protein MMC20_002843 [Loxospora ochrophaea]|nr:hypothetical protein [Loxospora ochrophaea]